MNAQMKKKLQELTNQLDEINNDYEDLVNEAYEEGLKEGREEAADE